MTDDELVAAIDSDLVVYRKRLDAPGLTAGYKSDVAALSALLGKCRDRIVADRDRIVALNAIRDALRAEVAILTRQRDEAKAALGIAIGALELDGACAISAYGRGPAEGYATGYCLTHRTFDCRHDAVVVQASRVLAAFDTDNGGNENV